MKRKQLITAGVLLLLFAAYLFYERTTPRRLTFAYTTEHVTNNTVEAPIGVVIPSLSISLPIFPATVTNAVWPTTDKGVSYLSTSPLPGQTGNSVMYAHNWPNLFGKLPQVKPGTKIIVIGKKNTVQTFSVIYTAVVDPTNASILAPSKDQRITLYTCTSLLDSKRFVVVAKLEQSS